jgi:gliding motility-associated-like protein
MVMIKRFYLAFLFILFNGLLFSQTSSTTDGCYPLTVTFTGYSNSSNSWEFGDGSVSEENNPSHIYTKAGTYIIKLNNKSIDTINVYEKPEIVLTTSPDKGCVPLVVNMSIDTKSPLPQNFSFDMNNITWNFQDGNNAKNTKSTSYIYSKAGVFDIGTSVNFLYKNNPIPSCNSAPLFEKQITTSLLNPTFSTTPPSGSSCTAPLTVTFKNNTVTSSTDLTYEWDFGNTNTSTAKDGTSQTYTQEGQYIVKLKMSDGICTKDANNRVISVGKPKADFETPNANDTVCLNNSFKFSNKSSSGSYTWTFDAGTSIATSNQSEPTISFSSPGTHTVKLSVNANGCSDEKTKTIFVEDPSVQISSTPTYTCFDTVTCFYSIKPSTNIGKIKNYNWTFPIIGNPKNTNTANPSCFYNTNDSTYHYRKLTKNKVDLVITTNAGCTSSKVSTIDSIYEVWARIVPDKYKGCLPLAINFSDSSSTHLKDQNKKLDSWFWDFGDGNTSTNQGKTAHTYTTTGVYQAKLIVKDLQSNCADTSYAITIKVGDVQNLSFDVTPTTICPGDEITLTNTTDNTTNTNISSWHYSSDKELISHCFYSDTIKTVIDDTIGTHTLTLTGEYNGCYSTSPAKTITVNGPISDFDYLQDCNTPSIVKLVNKAQGATSSQWIINNTIINATSDTNTIDLSTLNPAISLGTVKIKMISNGICPSNSDSTYIHYGTVKSNFIVEDENNNQLTSTTSNGKLIIGDQSTSSKYFFNATTSNDINPLDCYRGYSFLQESDRPNTYNIAIDSFYLSKKTQSQKPEDQIIKMVVRNANNCVDTSEINVRIFNLYPDFNSTIIDKNTNQPISISTVCLPTTIQLEDKSTADSTITNWLWEFSDGTTASGKNPGSHTFNSSSSNKISIVLTTTDINGFQKSKTQSYNIYKPIASITADKIINNQDTTIHICENDIVNFTANTIIGTNLNFQWTFVSSNKKATGTTSTSDPWKITSDLILNDTVKLHLTEPSTGCINDTFVKVNIEKYPNVKLTSDIKNGFACATESTSGTKSYNANFSMIDSLNTIGTQAQWQLGYNNSISSNHKPSLSYPLGKYDVTLELTTPNQCKKDTTFHFEVVEKPTGDFSVGPTTICKSESVTFQITKQSALVSGFKWDFDDGNIDTTNQKISHQYNILPPSGKVSAKLILINGECPSDPISKDVNIRYVKADFNVKDLKNNSFDSIVCFGDSYDFTNTSISSDRFLWIYDTNNQTSNSKDLTSVMFNSSGIKDVTLIASSSTNSCKDTITKKVFVKPLPIVEGISQVICSGKGQSIKLETKDTLQHIVYSWDKTDLQPTETETYVVTATDTIDHCVNKDDVLMIVIQPIAHIDWDTTIVIGDAIKLPIDNQFGTILFDWDPSTGLSCTNCPNPTIRPLADTVYNVKMHDTLNCFSETGIFKITVKPDTHIKLPTTFTPNGDGHNDVLYVRGWGIKELVTFEIYNRWGELIFKTNDIKVGWDGYYHETLQNSEVYAYKVIAKSWLGKEIAQEGFVHLMR